MGVTLKSAALAVSLVAGLAACDAKRVSDMNPVFDGVRFKASAKRAGSDDPRGFVATARPVSASRQGALLSAEHQAKALCIFYYGSSDITWDDGSLTAAQRVDGDSLQVSGQCDG